jgi:hypothetical protein
MTRQQEDLMVNGTRREVLILVDDVILTSNADEQLAHMAMRGRHFRVSLMMCAVSYTSLPKRMRRSLDVLLVYSVPMRGDMLVLTSEYCQGNNGVARFMMNNLKDHECLVLETLTKKQQLYTWKADLLELRDQQVQRNKSEASSERDLSQTSGSTESASEHPPPPHQSKISAPLDHTESRELRQERSISM